MFVMSSEERKVSSQEEQKPIPVEDMVTEDVRKLAKEVAQRKTPAVLQAIQANITLNVGVALKLHHSEEDFNWYSKMVEVEAHRIYHKKLNKAKRTQGVVERTKGGIILPS